jgi:SAM-dependent methyltransferase
MAYPPEYEAVHARWYDATYASRRADAAFYRDLARETGGPILELGCGTGRVLVPMAEDGLECTGLDGSPAMLDALRAKRPPPNLRLVLAPLQAFDLGRARFRLIFSAFRPLQHLYTVDDQLACLAAVRRHLGPDGLFAFDVFQPDLARLALAEEPEYEENRFADGDDEIVRLARVTRDVATQTQEVTMRYERRRDGAPVRSEVEHVRMRWYHRYELEHLLARAGFEVVALYGDFDRRSFDRHATEMVFVTRARRPEP